MAKNTSKKKPNPKKKKPSPKMLGTGTARKAAEAIRKRRKMLRDI